MRQKSPMLVVGYARTSSLSQVAGLEAQARDLRAAGCDKIFLEQVSSVAQREQLELALDYVREGDTFTVTELDRLARSVGDLLNIVARCLMRLPPTNGRGAPRIGVALPEACWVRQLLNRPQ